MAYPPRKTALILASMNRVTMIVNRFDVPVTNHLEPGSFDSLNPRQDEHNSGMDHEIDDCEANLAEVTGVTIDSLDLERRDLLKVDVECMEMDWLEVARRTIGTNQPNLVIEELTTDSGNLDGFGYTVFGAGMNAVAVHLDDPAFQMLVPR